MFTYICIPHHLQFEHLSKPACWYFSEMLLSLTFSVQSRAEPLSPGQQQSSRLPVPAAGGMPSNKLSAGCRRMLSGLPHWGSSAPEAREGLWPSLLHRLHEHMVQTAAAAGPAALCMGKGRLAGPSTSASCSILGIYSTATRALSRQKFVV